MADNDKDPTLYDVLHELIGHSSLGGFDKARLGRTVDFLDPDVDNATLEAEPLAPETPEQELARLRKENAELAAKAASVPAGVTGPGTEQ